MRKASSYVVYQKKKKLIMGDAAIAETFERLISREIVHPISIRSPQGDRPIQTTLISQICLIWESGSSRQVARTV